ncbi:MAG: DUF2939 domain-containing protein [Pseudomonadota bacterium]|nr:DUF2939 domain-containing protein [Pseudomonadota bacterium]
MRHSIHRDRVLVRPRLRQSRAKEALRYVLLPATAILILFFIWPYATLWRLDQAVRVEDSAGLAALVDLDAIRSEIKQKLNKDADSDIGELSDPFIRWLEEGISTMGNDAVDQLVTFEWVRGQLLAQAVGGADRGFLPSVSFAFFDAPDGFNVRIGPASGHPVYAHLQLRGLKWWVNAVYH